MRREINNPVVIAVEGADLYHLIIGHFGALEAIGEAKEFADVDIYDYKRAKYDLANGLGALLDVSAFKRSGVRALGIICDAENSRTDAEREIHRALNRYKLPTPGKPMEIASGEIAIGYLVLPHGRDTGCIESACLEASVLKPDHIACADEFLKLVLPHLPKQPNEAWQAKIKAHALIAGSGKEPNMTLGLSARAGLWNFGHASLKPILDFIRLMRG